MQVLIFPLHAIRLLSKHQIAGKYFPEKYRAGSVQPDYEGNAAICCNKGKIIPVKTQTVLYGHYLSKLLSVLLRTIDVSVIDPAEEVNFSGCIGLTSENHQTYCLTFCSSKTL